MIRLVGFLIFLACFVTNVVHAQERIAVVVNDEAISATDVHQRLRLVMVSSGFPDKKEVKDRLLPQIIASLIDEQLMIQESHKAEITVTPEQVAQGFAQLAEQNKMSPGELEIKLLENKIDIATLKRQITAQMSWNMFVQKKFRSQVNINDTDIDAFLERISEDVGKEEFMTAEILLHIPDPSQENTVSNLAHNIVKQSREDNAVFFRMAQQFSKAPGAQQGGNIGWIQEGQLPTQLDTRLRELQKGQISEPIRTKSGYHIFFVRDKRIITDTNIPSREQVRSLLSAQRLERMQARHLMDLKSAAFIENRV